MVDQFIYNLYILFLRLRNYDVKIEMKSYRLTFQNFYDITKITMMMLAFLKTLLLFYFSEKVFVYDIFQIFCLHENHANVYEIMYFELKNYTMN